MASGRFAHEYQKQQVNGASPVQLVVMLYDGALRFMEAGKHAIVNKNLEKQNYYIQKAQRIVTELMATLDMEKGGEVAKNLFALYGYVLNELVTANIQDEIEAVDRAIRVFSELRESWAQIAEATAPQNQPMAA